MMSALSGVLSIVMDATITVTAVELLLLLVVLSICLVLRCNKTGLIAAYAFSYKWGWSLFADARAREHLLSYLIFGMLVGVLAVIGMLRSPDR